MINVNDFGNINQEIEIKLNEELVTQMQPNLFYVNDDLSAEVDTRDDLEPPAVDHGHAVAQPLGDVDP